MKTYTVVLGQFFNCLSFSSGDEQNWQDVYELPLDLFDSLITRLPAFGLQKLQSQMLVVYAESFMNRLHCLFFCINYD